MNEPAKLKRWVWIGRKLPGYFAARFKAYRAQNPGQILMNIPTDVVIEIYQATAERWEARSRPFGPERTPKRFVKLKEIRCSSLDSAISAIEASYTNRVGDWQLYNPAGLIVEPEEVTEQQ